MIRVLFVCHGNICRSPLAEFVLKDLVRKRGLADQFNIQSAATSTEEIGNDVYPPTKRCMDAHGISYARRAARQLRASEADQWDYFIGMDDANMRNMRRMLPARAHGKLYKLLEFADCTPGETPRSGASAPDVADPWYTRNFEQTFDDVLRGCEGFLNAVR